MTPAPRRPRYRVVAPSLFTLTGRSHLEAGSANDHLRWAGEMLQVGADCIYCSGSMDRVEFLAKEYIPVVGHVGLVRHSLLPMWSVPHSRLNKL